MTTKVKHQSEKKRVNNAMKETLGQIKEATRSGRHFLFSILHCVRRHRLHLLPFHQFSSKFLSFHWLFTYFNRFIILFFPFWHSTHFQPIFAHSTIRLLIPHAPRHFNCFIINFFHSTRFPARSPVPRSTYPVFASFQCFVSSDSHALSTWPFIIIIMLLLSLDSVSRSTHERTRRPTAKQK